jgi:hypothetical protein
VRVCVCARALACRRHSSELWALVFLGNVLPIFFETSCCCCTCRWGETTSLNCGHQRAYCSTPRWYIWVCRATVEWYWQGKTEGLWEKNLSQCHFVAYGLTRASANRRKISTNAGQHNERRGHTSTAWVGFESTTFATAKPLHGRHGKMRLPLYWDRPANLLMRSFPPY